jgi:hypothetical protein
MAEHTSGQAATRTPRWASLRWWGIDIVLVGVLAAYILAGVPVTTFHGDEGMQVYATRDFITAFVERDPLALTTTPPYPIDSRAHLRIINGSVQRYAAGAVLHLRGHNAGDLNREPGWNWGRSYNTNIENDYRPKRSILLPARYTSAAFYALGLLPLLGLARLLGGRWAAYPALTLYALNPLTLLNARRAVMEGSLLAFGLLTIWAGVTLADRVRRGERAPWWLWAGLGLAGALTLASKHSGAIFLVGAWGWAGIGVIAGRRWRDAGALAVAGMVAIMGFVALSPALWNNPPVRLTDLVRLRAELLTAQVAMEGDRVNTLPERAAGIIVWPFGAPQHSERPEWYDAEDFAAQVTAYEVSPWRGHPTHPALTVLLWGLVVVGGVILVRRSPVHGLGALWWAGITALALLGNPLPWARYALPLVPALLLLAGVGCGWICEQTRTLWPLQTGET